MLDILKYTTVSVEQMDMVIDGMRNPMNSWSKSDSEIRGDGNMDIGENDAALMIKLAKNGVEHRKFMRMMPVYVTINAPLYWWKEMDTYTVGKVQNSCSTMHRIHSKEFDRSDFSCEHLSEDDLEVLDCVIAQLNRKRDRYLEGKNKDNWWSLIQLLPSSYNQRRTVMLSYEVLGKIRKERKMHKLDEWKTFLKWGDELPFAPLFAHF